MIIVESIIYGMTQYTKKLRQIVSDPKLGHC